MLVPLFALGITSFYALMEHLTGQRQTFVRYFVWYFAIVGSMYMAKAYCDDVHDDIHADYIWDNQDDDEIDWDIQCKFVPPGTPSNYINADDSLSEKCLQKVKSTSREIAYDSLAMHKEKGEEYYNTAKEICWYLPNVSDREQAKIAFTAVVALFPGPIHYRLVAATGAMLAQYGICCIDAFYDVDFNMNMSKFHFRLVNAFHDHIKSNGW